MDELGRSAARGAGITFAAQIARVGMQMASVVVLARLLTPTEYGVMTMVLVFVGVGEIFRDLGLSTAAMRAPTITHAQRSNLFWVNTAIGAGLGILMVAAAPLVGAIFDEDAVVPVARAVGVVFLLNGMASQLRADLVRTMRFGALAVVDVVSQAAAIVVAVVLGLAGAGVWALVGQQVLQSLVLLVMLATTCRWVPSRPRRGVPMGEFWHFGWNLAASQVAVYIGNNIDNFVIGAQLGTAQLGTYDRAFKLVMTPVAQVRAPTTTIALPVLSRLQGDPARFARFLARGQIAIAYPVMIGAALLVGTADPATQILLGSGWVGVEPLVRLLATTAVMQTLAYVGYWVYLSHGLSDLLLRFTVVTIAVKVVLVVVASHWGLVGVAVGDTLAHTVEWPLSILWLSRRAPIPTRTLMLGAVRVLLVGGTLAGTAHVVSGLFVRVWPATLAGVGAGLLSLALLALVVPRVRRDVVEVAAIVRTALARRRR